MLYNDLVKINHPNKEEKPMKKTLALVLALMMVVALFAGCNNDPQPTTPTEPSTPVSTVMTHAEYLSAAEDAAVEVECYVQATQCWWDNKIVVYAQDMDGAYFMYNMECSEEDSAKLVPGAKIRVTGFKAAYKGEVEVIDCTFEVLEGTWIAPAFDVTNLLASADLINYQNMFAAIKGAKVVASVDANGNEVAFLYNWNGSGVAGNDLYFNIEVGGVVYNMCVESYLCGDGTAVYDAVEALNIGDVINLEGFLYWYDGVNPHITSVEVVG